MSSIRIAEQHDNGAGLEYIEGSDFWAERQEGETLSDAVKRAAKGGDWSGRQTVFLKAEDEATGEGVELQLDPSEF